MRWQERSAFSVQRFRGSEGSEGSEGKVESGESQVTTGVRVDQNKDRNFKRRVRKVRRNEMIKTGRKV